MTGCSVDGCTGLFKGRGLCNKHLIRLRKTGTTSSPMDRTIPDRFWDTVSVGGSDACWPWRGRDLHKHGYGFFTVTNTPRVRVLAHRFSYQLATGENIDGLVIRHRCDNPPCVNPAHLLPGTQADNVGDAISRGRLDTTGLALGRQVGIKRRRRS